MRKSAVLSVVLSLLFIAVLGCSGGGESGGKATVGSSCEGIGSMGAKFACDGSKVLFCSSLTKYKYQVQTECNEKQVCKVLEGGKSSKCEAK